jgi:hypothetical protein
MRPVVKVLLVAAAIIAFGYIFIGNLGSQKIEFETNSAEIVPVGELTDGTEIIQSFSIGKSKTLSAVAIKLATYIRVNEGKIIVSVRRSAHGDTIYSKSVDASSIADNEYLVHRFPPIRFMKNDTYYLSIKSIGAGPGRAITAYKTSDDADPDGELWIDGIPQTGDLVIKTYTFEPWFARIFNLFT